MIVADDGSLVVNLGAYDGPIDLLLGLARDQKVDLTRISILALAEQYLAFIAAAKRLRLEIAADYLVMAAWLAFLKSKLLLPPAPSEPEPEPTAAQMEAALRYQLQRLQAMQEAGTRLMARGVLGRDVFVRGIPEGVPVETTEVWDIKLIDLLKAYAEHRNRAEKPVLRIVATELDTMEAAIERLSHMLGSMHIPDWTTLQSFLPAGLRDDTVGRSHVAATLSATLELVRTGRLQIRQDSNFGPIYLRRPPENQIAEFPADRTTQ
ncbi:MAG: segregation/condensation protein A [Proteobacteria bacterium]|nr:segregation/condensation protein A [Pseudomonadota bacterium]